MTPALDNLLATPLEAGVKGLPHGAGGVLLSDITRQHWNLLEQQLPLPCAVISQPALESNAAWMQDFLSKKNVLLAPHGKTTMAPQLFDLQLRNGAWGITVATVQQLEVCRRFGVQRILMANQLVGAADIEYVAGELCRDAAFEFYCLVDSIDGVERLQQVLARAGTARPLRVLVEMGVPGGRTGCRTMVEAIRVAGRVATQPDLALYGVECYEGIISSADLETDEQRITGFLRQLAGMYQECRSRGLFADPRHILLSAGGSAWFDRVVSVLGPLSGEGVQVIVRSGCYLPHDSLYYQRHFRNIQARCAAGQNPEGSLRPALEVWAWVQSVPEPGLVVLNLGKRDISHDLDLPVPEKWFRPGQMQRPEPLAGESAISALHDQHACLQFSGATELAMGDMVALGISHPCTTFDKWQLLWLVDDEYNVTGGIRTFF